jgi:hypothetical protein
MSAHFFCENCNVWFDVPPLDPKLHEELHRHRMTRTMNEQEFKDYVAHYDAPEKVWKIIEGTNG